MNTDTCCQRPDTGVKFFFYLNRLNLLNLAMKLLASDDSDRRRVTNIWRSPIAPEQTP